MKQVLRKGIAEIIVGEVPDPVLTPHHVAIRPVFSLISSGTETASIHQEGVIKEVADNPSHLRKVWDVAKLMGPLATAREVRAKFGDLAALGYSGAGVIVEKHPSVQDLEVGQRVAYGGEGTGHAETILTGRNLVAPLPDGVLFEHACFATLGSIALNAVRIANISLGDSVAVVGLGLVGQLVSQLARLQGARVIGLDLKSDRIQLAQKLGAHHGLANGGRDAVAAITGGHGADVVILAAASKSDAPSRLALDICRDRGRIVVVGAVDMHFPWNEMYMKEIQLFMSRAYGPGSYDPTYEQKGIDYPYPYVRWTENRNMAEFLRLVETGDLSIGPLVTHRFALDQAPAAYNLILDPSASSLAVLLEYARPSDQGFTPNRKVVIAPQPVSKDILGFALVGAGNLARWSHIPAVKKLPGVRLRAVQSGGAVRATSYGTRFETDYATTDLQEILGDQSIDAVLLTGRNHLHAGQAAAALRAGKHVFVEKPMALTIPECRDVLDAVDASGRVLTVGFNRRFAPFYRALQEQVQKRNGPVTINCRVNSPGISGTYWMADPSIGGAILGEACHFVDLFCWLLGSDPVSCMAYSLPLNVKSPVGSNNLACAFSFADGSIATLNYSTVGSSSSGGERVEVFGEGFGAVTENFNRLSIRRGIPKNSSRIWGDKGYRAQMNAFLHSIRTGQPPLVSAWDGARATLLCLDLLESARSGLPRPTDLSILRSS